MKPHKLKAPFPYFGGKARVADLVWQHLGNVANYIEPFCGSAAVLLARPDAPKFETVNDADCYLANFWRATQAAPDLVAEFADGPVNEADLHARHRWLVLSDHGKAFREAMRTDPFYYDARVAGWWVWGLGIWFGSGWCGRLEAVERKGTLHQKRPILAVGGRVNGVGACIGQGVHSNGAARSCKERRAWLVEWFGKLRDRLCNVRVCCGDWLRVCNVPSVTTRLGLTGLFLDPPYGNDAGRDMRLYGAGEDSGTVAVDVRNYCLERGADPRYRIVLAGYAGEGHEVLEARGWTVLDWKAIGGYGNRSTKGQANARRERLWISPHCLRDGKGHAPPETAIA